MCDHTNCSMELVVEDQNGVPRPFGKVVETPFGWAVNRFLGDRIDVVTLCATREKAMDALVATAACPDHGAGL